MPHPVDAHVGKRLRQRRNLLNVSQQDLAEQVGITFQQVQKYEHGVNRVSSSRLYEFAKVLAVDIPYFFEGLPSTVQEMHYGVSDQDQAGFSGPDHLITDEHDLVAAYRRIKDKGLREHVLELVKNLAPTGSKK
ncbi:helix-turn-helix domain-containing protein [bacterium]|nr:helix-turn-helix domain-containing protein [bacterium]